MKTNETDNYSLKEQQKEKEEIEMDASSRSDSDLKRNQNIGGGNDKGVRETKSKKGNNHDKAKE